MHNKCMHACTHDQSDVMYSSHIQTLTFICTHIHSQFSGPHCEILAARIKYYLEGKGAEEGCR